MFFVIIFLFQPLFAHIPGIFFEKEMKLTHESVSKKDDVCCYRLHSQVDPLIKKNERNLFLSVINTFGEHTYIHKLLMDSSGKIFILNDVDKKPLDEWDISLVNFMDGEAITYAIFDTSSHMLAATTIFPSPICAKDKDGAYFEMRLCSKTGNYEVSGEGFKPNELLHTLSESEDELLPSSFAASNKGEIIFYINPQVICKLVGKAKLKIKRSSGNTLEAAYSWITWPKTS